jgi:hypothetical protein
MTGKKSKSELVSSEGEICLAKECSEWVMKEIPWTGIRVVEITPEIIRQGGFGAKTFRVFIGRDDYARQIDKSENK